MKEERGSHNSPPRLRLLSVSLCIHKALLGGFTLSKIGCVG